MSTYEPPSGPTSMGSGPPVAGSPPNASDGGGAAEKAADVAREAKGQASEVAGAVGQHGREVVHDATAQARDLVGETRIRLRDQADEQARAVAAQLSEAGDDLLMMSDASPHPGHPVVEATRQLGERVSQLGDHVASGGLAAVMGDAKRFARRRPLAFIGASLAVGIVVGRVLRNADTRAVAEAAKDELSEDDGSTRERRDEPAVTGVPRPGTSEPRIAAPIVGSSTP